MDVGNQVFAAGMCCQLFCIAGHSTIIYIINKAALRDNRFFLIASLSLSDMIVAIFFIINLIFFRFNEILSGNEMVSVVAYFITMQMMVMFLCLSLQITMLITIDRYFAVKYSITYQQKVKKEKLKTAIWVMLSFDAITVFVLGLMTNTKQYTSLFMSNGRKLFLGTLRIITCIVIINTGIIVIRARNRSEKELKRVPKKLHGIQAEKLGFYRSIQNSIKDVVVLNFWTVILLIPLIVNNFLMLFTNGTDFTTENGVTTTIASLSNPIIYLLTQRNIRKWVSKNILRRSKVDVCETSF